MKRTKVMLQSFLAVLTALAFVACQAPTEVETEAPADTSQVSDSTDQQQAQDSATTKPQEDREGNPIEIPDQVDTIVSLAPSTTQIIEDLGLKDKLVAVDSQSPSYVEGIDDLPQLDMMQLDVEQLADLDADIVFASGISTIEDDPFTGLREMGHAVATIPSSASIEDVKLDVLFVAQALGEEEAGQALIDDMEADIQAIADIGQGIEDKKAVYFEIAAAPDIYSFGQHTFLHEMIEIIGAENVFADQEGWIPVNEEDAIATNPDVILTNVNYIDDPIQEILNRPGWDHVDAVAQEEVHYIDNGASSLPNHRIVEALKQMAQAVYPDHYTN